jgi:hypothetical protein
MDVLGCMDNFCKVKKLEIEYFNKINNIENNVDLKIKDESNKKTSDRSYLDDTKIYKFI